MVWDLSQSEEVYDIIGDPVRPLGFWKEAFINLKIYKNASNNGYVSVVKLDISNRLESLPAEVANLKDLRALWLSETQGSVTLPTLNLEMRGTRKVLTCMLLPQKTASMENLLTVSRDSLHVLKYYNGQHEASFINGDEYDASKEGDYDTGTCSIEVRKHRETTSSKLLICWRNFCDFTFQLKSKLRVIST